MTLRDVLTTEEWAELLDLSLDGALPEGWQARVDAGLAEDPAAAADAQSLRAVVERFRSAPAPRPDGWFVERALAAALQEHRAETTADDLVSDCK